MVHVETPEPANKGKRADLIKKKDDAETKYDDENADEFVGFDAAQRLHW